MRHVAAEETAGESDADPQIPRGGVRPPQLATSIIIATA